MADGSRLGGCYSDELIKALWSDADEAAVRSWEQQKRAAFDAGGELKATHGTRAADRPRGRWRAARPRGDAAAQGHRAGDCEGARDAACGACAEVARRSSSLVARARCAQTFLARCTGEPPEPPPYKGSVFHRVVPGFVCEGGELAGFSDEARFAGERGARARSVATRRARVTRPRSIPGPSDESFELRHMGPGVLSMSNRGPDTNGSQFGIFTAAAPWLDGRHVVFGKVVRGYGVVQAVEALGSEPHGRTSQRVVVRECGALDWSDPGFPGRDGRD